MVLPVITFNKEVPKQYMFFLFVNPCAADGFSEFNSTCEKFLLHFESQNRWSECVLVHIKVSMSVSKTTTKGNWKFDK